MQTALLQLLGGVLLLYLGGELLVRGSVTLAAFLGIRPLVAGLTIVAFGTSAPELAVTLDAALEGFDDVAVGSIVGSNICNIALILGVSAIIRPIRVDPQLFRFDLPVMLGAAAILVALLLDDGISRSDGMLLVLGILGYVAVHLWLALSRRNTPDPPEHAGPSTRYSGTRLAPPMIVAGLVALAGGGYFVVHGGVEMAKSLGVSNAVIGLTVVAIGTSLPELSTALIAALRRHGEIALGNVVGTNVFNVFAILGLTAAIHPLVRGGVGWIDLLLMCLLSVLLVPLAWTGLRLDRREGALLLGCFAAYWWWRLAG